MQVSFSPNISKTQNISKLPTPPQAVFCGKDKFVKPNDAEASELTFLCQNYLSEPTKENKIKILNQEQNMLWEELDNRMLTIQRNSSALKRIDYKEGSLFSGIDKSNLNGLIFDISAHESLSVKIELDKNKIRILNKVVDDTDKSPHFKNDILDNSLYVFSKYYNRTPNNDVFKNDFIEFLDKIESKCENKGTLNTINKIKTDCLSEDELVENILNNNNVENNIEILSHKKSPRLTPMLKNFMTEETPTEIKKTAVWAAGRNRSNENFKILKGLIADKSEENEPVREIAIHSAAMYLKSNNEEVKSILKTVINEKSDLSELASILLEKVEGRYYKKDKVLDLYELSKKDRTSYINAKDKIVKANFKINNQKHNALDEAFLPLKNVFKAFGGTGFFNLKNLDIQLVDDTITRIEKAFCGVRVFRNNFSNSGMYEDAVSGVSIGTLNVVNKNSLAPSNNNNTVAHEFTHAFHRNKLSSQDSKTLDSLYKKAVEENKCIDAYATTNVYEYFAQGYEAFISVYKPHSTLMEKKDFQSTVYNACSDLKRKDPDLYNFIEHCIKKYGEDK